MIPIMPPGTGQNDEEGAMAAGILAKDGYVIAMQRGLLKDGQPCLVLLARIVLTGDDKEDIDQRAETMAGDIKDFVQRKDGDGIRSYPTAVHVDVSQVGMAGKINVEDIMGKPPAELLDHIRKTLKMQGMLDDEDIEAAIEFANQQMGGAMAGMSHHGKSEYTPLTVDQILDVVNYSLSHSSWEDNEEKGHGE